MAVDSGYAAWLKAPALYASAIPANAAAWAGIGLTSEILSPLAFKAAAQAEAVRQAAFLTGPLARDRMLVHGLQSALIGYPVTIRGDRLGYEGDGATVFVIGAQESDRTKTTMLTVIKRLAA